MIAGMDAYNGDREPVQMWSGFGLAGIAWGSYWLIPTDGRR
jgi:hypothetical protein